MDTASKLAYLKTYNNFCDVAYDGLDEIFIDVLYQLYMNKHSSYDREIDLCSHCTS